MARIAMAKDQCWRVGAVVALVFALAGMVGASSVTDVADTNVPMLTLDHNLIYSSSSRQAHDHHPRERRRLATAMVWCVAKSNLSDAMLQGALDWVCGPLPAQGQVNCFPVQSGQSCFLPDSVQTHASWAFNVYFKNHNATDDACDFQGTAMQSYTDPSTATCVFVGSTKEINGTISNGTIMTPPPGITFSGAAPMAGFEPQFLFHLLAVGGVVMLMTHLLT